MENNLDALIHRRAEIIKELYGINRSIEDAANEVYRLMASEKIIVQRYFDGDTIIISNSRHWWVNVNGDLLGAVDNSDVDELRKLTKNGIFERIAAYRG